jgi:hypothetical protein
MTGSFYKQDQSRIKRQTNRSCFREQGEYLPLKTKVMRAILSTIAIIVVIGWAIGYFGYHTGGLFHLILVIALIAIVLQLIPGRRD